ncbi:transcriptional regulator, AraC family (plasmid) [Paracoccus aminophilus JCM 7686]|uniref:Transcriptional regulator, AraC family n=2 Tax=Paracoccus aminophilus TaxID=34003 RepID=S5YHN1_PARAH|nr:transcriptional regulator, AraC family [Paracoccus aminophilus JCM 7686]
MPDLPPDMAPMRPIATRRFDPDASARPVIALRLDFRDYAREVPVHRHQKGQLVMALHGAVTCRLTEGWWLVPPEAGVWIPGGLDHSNLATANARLVYLFVAPDAPDGPEQALPAEACTLALSPMLREMILHLAAQSQKDATETVTDPATDPAADPATARLIGVILDNLHAAPRQNLHLPVSAHPRIREIAAALTETPSDRRKLGDWARAVAMSERSLARLFESETGLAFGQWRRQLHLLIALRALAGGASVQHVAEELGYASVTAFITMFRKSLGTTPARYFSRTGGGARPGATAP